MFDSCDKKHPEQRRQHAQNRVLLGGVGTNTSTVMTTTKATAATTEVVDSLQNATALPSCR